MTRQKTGTKYDTIKIPEGLTAKIDTLLKDSKNDYTSRTDVIKMAVRLLYWEKFKKY
jgi:Arc/MetJ-type ribon-helix-helix transcriptional regulator